ncbi:MAG: histidine--tRNA ligase [Verrucomicrobiota bacterium]|nr:histidine--tRNA ligase [Verrucomicrobiota bacterium]
MERLPGFRDFYPEPLPYPEAWSADLRTYIFSTWRSVAKRYGFREYDGPPLESLELFTTKSGEEIVGQLYNFIDKGERAVALRPEMTPTLARMVASTERQYKKPIKWFAIPQLFRYERQQKGRLREHFQFNADIFGESGTSADGELVALLIDSLRAFGLTEEDFVIRLSSRNAWRDFFAKHSSENSNEYAFYQAVDKIERDSAEESEKKFAAVGFKREQVVEFINAATPTEELAAVIADLTARGLGNYVRIDYNVIRGLAYYTGVVFEAFDRKGEFRAIAGGGRYDNLVGLISGEKVKLAGLGFGMGDVVLAELLKKRELIPRFQSGIEVYFAITDETVRATSLSFVQQLRQGGISTDYSFTPAKYDKQLKRAIELGAKALAEVVGSQIKVKNLATREEQLMSSPALIEWLKKT